MTDPKGADAGASLTELLGEGATRRAWRRPWPWLAIVVLAVAALTLFGPWRGNGQPAGPQYLTEPVRRDTLRVTVVANGTLAPTLLVNIGSELSGTVTDVLVDINDRVKKGQVLVELDTSKLRDQISRSRAALASAEARVAQTAATLKEARANLTRMDEVSRLSGGKVPSATEYDGARATVDRAAGDEAAARAAVADARAALSADETNLRKASIRSPIDGVVLSRNVDPGNAVAASLQAVTLLTIAEDLKRMKLQVNVDEADVGQVHAGQNASFTVAAWPNRRYPATITRVGYGSTTKENVVTYVAELDVANQDLTLRPGMTATASIAAAERPDVLLVPNAALRFSPANDAASARKDSGGLVSRLIPRPPRAAPKRPASDGSASQRQVWVLRDGQAVAVPVTVGLSDGSRTEVNGDLREGDAVITDQVAAKAP